MNYVKDVSNKLKVIKDLEFSMKKSFREIDKESVELYRKYRPTTLDEIVGQPTVVKMLKELFKEDKLPHAILLSGFTGSGKTTTGRVIQYMLKCDDLDFYELNCGDDNGIDTIRRLNNQKGRSALKSPCRIWLLDECQNLSKDAMTALLKILEDTPPNLYIILATTDPQKLLKTIHTRCTEFKLQPLDSKAMENLVTDVCKKEKVEIDEEVMERLISVSDGSARKALVLLHQILQLSDIEDQLNCLLSNDAKKQAIDIARAIMDPRNKWLDVAKILEKCDEEPETIRHLVLSYASKILLSGGKLAPKAYLVICAFENHFFDSKRSGILRACWEVMNSN